MKIAEPSYPTTSTWTTGDTLSPSLLVVYEITE